MHNRPVTSTSKRYTEKAPAVHCPNRVRGFYRYIANHTHARLMPHVDRCRCIMCRFTHQYTPPHIDHVGADAARNMAYMRTRAPRTPTKMPRMSSCSGTMNTISNILQRPGEPAEVQPNGNCHWVAPPLVHPVSIPHWKMMKSCHRNLKSVGYYVCIQ